MQSDWLDQDRGMYVCPRCGKRSLAKVSEHRYDCLWCSFSRDLSRGRLTGQTDPGIVVVVLIAIAITLMAIS